MERNERESEGPHHAWALGRLNAEGGESRSWRNSLRKLTCVGRTY